MFILMLIVVFALVFFSLAFAVQLAGSIRNNHSFNGIPHGIILSSAVTFLVVYFVRT